MPPDFNSNANSQTSPHVDQTGQSGQTDPSLATPTPPHPIEAAGMHLAAKTDLVRTANLLAAAINEHTEFTRQLGMVFGYEDGKMVGRFDHAAKLIGNPNFRILHGGVAATMLDTIGGLEAMLEIYRRDQGTQEDKINKVKRMATVDLRIDYLAPGRGQSFIATAEVIRMGRKGCTTRMMLHNNEGKAIAHGIASYAY